MKYKITPDVFQIGEPRILDVRRETDGTIRLHKAADFSILRDVIRGMRLKSVVATLSELTGEEPDRVSAVLSDGLNLIFDPDVCAYLDHFLGADYHYTLSEYNKAVHLSRRSASHKLPPSIIGLALRVATKSYDNPAHLIRELKRTLTKHAWRMLVSFPSAVIARTNPETLYGLAIYYSYSSRPIDERVLELGTYILEDYPLIGVGGNDRPALSEVGGQVLRLAYDELTANTDATSLDVLKNQWPEIRDYLYVNRTQNVAGWSWRSLEMRSAVWHRERVRGRHPYRYWHSHVVRWDDPETGITAYALQNSNELSEEADKMHHCVDIYATRCYDNKSRIFHLARSAAQYGTPAYWKPGATLELILDERTGVARLAQLKGPYNRGPSPDFRRTAHNLVRIYNVGEEENSSEH